MPLTLLATADLHLGRISAQTPPGLSADAAHSRRVWEAIVSLACEREVAAILIAGDLIDAANRRWEAMGPIVRGITRLAEAGVRTIAVAGNHDWESLPRLARLLADQKLGPEAFTLLGGGGRWESLLVERGGESVRIEGWSFPKERVTVDPLSLRERVRGASSAAIGLLHGDLGNSGSVYGPLQRRTLEDAGVDGWILGHVHKPSLQTFSRSFALYAGSPQALDFGEQGAHGAWLLDVRGGAVERPTFVPLSSVRYETLPVDLSSAEGIEEAELACLTRLRELEGRCRRESGPAIQGLSVRLQLVGRSAAQGHGKELQSHLLKWDGSGALAVAVKDVEDLLLPAIDLEAIARGPETSPLTLLARLLLATAPASGDLSSATHEVSRACSAPHPPGFKALTEKLLRQLEDVDRRPEYAALEEDDDTAATGGEEGTTTAHLQHRASGREQSVDWAMRAILVALLRQEAG